MCSINAELNIDLNNRVEYPDVYLAHRNLEVYALLYPVDELKIKLNLNGFHEVEFKAYRVVNGKENENWNRIVDNAVIFIPQFGYYEAHVTTITNGLTETKVVSGVSLEVELDHIKLFDFQANSDDINDSSYQPIKFYNPLDTEHSLLHLVLKKAPSWSILHVDNKLWDRQRTFSVNDVSIYGLLTGDISKEFECLFQFDTFHRTISCFELEDFGKKTAVYLDCSNYVQEIKLEAEKNSVYNWFKVSGGDDVIDIREVNPNGTDYVTVLGENDYADMSPELVGRLDSYDILYQQHQPQFVHLMTQIQKKLEEVWDLHHKYPDTPNPPSHSSYGLNYLLEMEEGLKEIEDTYTTMGYGNPKDRNYGLYSANHAKLVGIQQDIQQKKADIDVEEASYAVLKGQRDAIQNALNLENYLGRKLWLELSNYRRESTYENSFFTVTDITTDAERIQMELELMDRATKDLQKACNPQPTLTSTVCNLMARREFRDFYEGDFQLGNWIHIGVNDNYVAGVQLLSLQYDFCDIGNIVVVFGDVIEAGASHTSQIKDILDQAQSASKSYEIVERQMGNASDHLGYVAQIRENGLDTALTTIKASQNQGQEINQHGILCREWSDAKNDWEPEQLKIINSLICFTNDKWNSVQMALGRINVNNHMVYGLLCDALVGKWVFTENAYIGNENNTMTFDKDGFISYSKDFKTVVKINPNNAAGLFEIWRGHGTPDAYRTLWTDSDGNLNIIGCFTADKIHTGYIKVSNGQNDIILDPNNPNGLFEIINNGKTKVYIDSGGNLCIYDSTFECGDINAARGYFKVDIDGNMTATSGRIGGFTLKDDVLFAGAGKTWIRISPATNINGEQFSTLSLGEADNVNPNTGLPDAILHLRSDGYCRLGLASDGCVRFNYEADAPYSDSGAKTWYTMHTKNFKIERDNGRVSTAGIYLRHGSAVRSYLDGQDKFCNLIRLSNEDAGDKITIGQGTDRFDVNVLAKKIYLKGDDGIEIKNGDKATIDGRRIATVTDLDRLVSEWTAKLNTKYNEGYSAGWSSGYNSGYNAGQSS